MEETIRINRAGLTKVAIFLVFGVFIMANAKAGLLAPTLTVSTSSTNVSKGDTVTINIESSVTVGVLSSIGCQYNGGGLPTNASFAVTGGGSLLDLGGSVDATLTITNMSSTTAGTYTFSSSTVGLLGGLLTTYASSTVTVTPTVTGVSSGLKMSSKGFEIQFSGPTGSNLVIQASTDMKHWTSISTNVITGGSVTYTDAAAMTMPGRYYRAMLK